MVPFQLIPYFWRHKQPARLVVLKPPDYNQVPRQGPPALCAVVLGLPRYGALNAVGFANEFSVIRWKLDGLLAGAWSGAGAYTLNLNLSGPLTVRTALTDL